ncbi:MAG: DUF3108 domain-containing protein [Xanthomonadales bacterium]
MRRAASTFARRARTAGPAAVATVVLLAGLAAAPAARPDTSDFEARLELYRNDTLTGEMSFRLASDARGWTMSTETQGTHGLARFLGLREHSVGEGDWVGEAPRPLRYERTVKAVRTLRWTADFDWTDGVVETVWPDGEATLELEPGVLDESAVGLVIRAGLARGEDEWRLRLVDEEKIEDAHFRSLGAQRLQTALGCLRVYVVEKVRRPQSTRYTRTWYAADHAFAPVLLEHGKTGGDAIEGRVVALTIEGAPVATAPDCAEP